MWCFNPGGLTRQTPAPYPSAPDYLASKVYWTIRIANEQFQVRWALDLITAFVNKRVNGESPRLSELTPELEGLEDLLEQIWVSDVQDTSGDYDIRRKGLLVYLHVGPPHQGAQLTGRSSKHWRWSGTPCRTPRSIA